MPSDSITEKGPDTEPSSSTAITATAPTPTGGLLAGGADDKPADPADPALGAQGPRFVGFDRLLAFLLLGLVFLLGSFAVNNSDVLMQLATGRRIVQGEYQFGVDPYSYMTQESAQKPATTWINHSWLYSVYLYLLYGAVGESGLVFVHACLLVALALVLLNTRDRRSPLLAGVFVTGFALLALSARYYMQPAAISMLLFGILLHLLYRAGVFGGIEAERVKPRLLWGIPLLCVLWVNLDNWFILAPLTLGLVWLATGVNHLLSRPNPVAGKDIGVVFGVTLLAGLLNPHLHRAYILPPELSYFFVSLGVTLPDFLGAGAYALDELNRQGPFNFLFSPLNNVFFSNPTAGGNVAGWSFFVLVFIGFMTFLSQILATAAEGRSVQVTRLVPWLFFLVLALRHSILVPWFALVSGVVTALNMGEWLQEREAVNKSAEAGPARLARLFSMLLLVAGLALAWPGWLHTRIGHPVSSRRVAWEFHLDPAQIEMAQTLNRLNEEGKVKNVFNFQRDAAHYCAWYAPNVRCFFDSRFNLFADVAPKHARWRQALADEAELFFRQRDPGREKAAGDEWRAAFRAHEIDHIVFHLVGDREGKQRVVVQKVVLQPGDWTLQFVKGQIALFAWGGLTDTRPGEDYLKQRSVEVFTRLPEERRPPAEGFQMPLPPDPWDVYAKGRPESGAMGDSSIWLVRFNAGWGPTQPFEVASRFGGLTGQLGGMMLSVPAEAVPPFALLSMGYRSEWLDFPFFPTGFPFLRPDDFGPPAIPLLMIHDARRHLAKHPLDLGGYLQLSQAYETLHEFQEQYWSGFAGRPADQEFWVRNMNTLLQEKKDDEKKPDGRVDGKVDGKTDPKKDPKNPPLKEEKAKRPPNVIDPHTEKWRQAAEIMRQRIPRPEARRRFDQRDSLVQATSFFSQPAPTFRRQLRYMQSMAYIRLAADLHQDNPDLQIGLAQLYMNLHYLDAALDRLNRALTALKPSGSTQDAAKKRDMVEKQIEALEKVVKERRDQFERNKSGMMRGHPNQGPGWKLLYNFAILDPYRRFEKGENDPFGRGIPLALLEAYQEVPRGDMEEQEYDIFRYHELDLKLRLGLVEDVDRELSKDLSERKNLGPGMMRTLALFMAIVGNYEEFDRYAAQLQQTFNPQALSKELARKEGAVLGASLGSLPGAPPVFLWLPFDIEKVDTYNRQFITRVQQVDACLVRGLMALEAGDGMRAKARFNEARELAGEYTNHPFLNSELHIAERYLDWMKRVEEK